MNDGGAACLQSHSMSNSSFQEISSTAMVPLASRDNVHLIRSWTLARSCRAGPNLTSQTANAVGGHQLTLTPVRGTPVSQENVVHVARFIPARAGNTRSTRTASYTLTVHPRPCGEHGVCLDGGRIKFGSSPPVRGTHSLPLCGYTCRRFIPARAGNTRDGSANRVAPAVHPRPCGEHCHLASCRAKRGGSSPPVRGTRGPARAAPEAQRFIPARAGNTHYPADVRATVGVHPRPCGEHCPAR